MKRWSHSLAALPLALKFAPQLKRTPPDWQTQSDLRLRQTIAHCFQHAPFYREQWAASGLSPEPIQQTADVARLPIVSRSAWRAAPSESFGDAPRLALGAHESSSGTGGSRFTMPYSWQDVVTNRALIMAVYMNQGVPWFGLLNWNLLTRSTESGRWRHSGQVLTISSRLPSAELFSTIRQFRPRLVRCSPWQAWRAVVGALRAGEPIPQVPVLVTGSEVVTPIVRRTLQHSLTERPINHYGATDSGHLATGCVAGRLHYCWLTTHLEVLADNDQPAQPGEPGEVVVTNLVLRRRPVVRVRTGDLAVLGQGPCPCGNPTPHFAYVVGRKKDRLILPTGQTVTWPELETELAEFGPYLLGYQIEQIDSQQVLFRLCLLEPAPNQTEIENRLRAKLPGLQVAFAVTDTLQSSPTGKTLPVIGLEV